MFVHQGGCVFVCVCVCASVCLSYWPVLLSSLVRLSNEKGGGGLQRAVASVCI